MHSGHLQLRHDSSFPNSEEITNLDASTEVSGIEVLANHHAFCLVGGDGKIWGAGLRAQGMDKTKEKF